MVIVCEMFSVNIFETEEGAMSIIVVCLPDSWEVKRIFNFLIGVLDIQTYESGFSMQKPHYLFTIT